MRYVAIIFLASVFLLNGQVHAELSRDEAFKILDDAFNVNVDQFDAYTKSELIAFANSLAYTHKGGSFEALVLLLRLKDKEAMDKTLQALRAEEEIIGLPINPYNAKDALILAQNPDIIGKVGELLYRDEPKSTSKGDVSFLSKSALAVEILQGIVGSCNNFHIETRTWAKSMKVDVDQQQSREFWRKWYRENEKSLLARDYASVRPGDPVPIKSSD